MTSPEITDDIRRRVHVEDCERLGHQLSFLNALLNEIRNGRTVQTIGSPDPLKLPHLTCARCGYVWLALPSGDWSYGDAERLLYGMLRADSDLARLIVRNRGTTATAVPLIAEA